MDAMEWSPMKVPALTLIIAMVVPLTAGMADDSPSYLISTIGVGNSSCGDYIDYEKQGNSTQMSMFVQWAWGYLVAYSG